VNRFIHAKIVGLRKASYLEDKLWIGGGQLAVTQGIKRGAQVRTGEEW